MDKDTQRISDFRQLVHRLNEIGDKKNIAIVWAEDEHTLQAVAMAAEAGFANPILVCSEQTAKAYSEKYETVVAQNPQEAAEIAVQMVKQNKADALMKGFVNTDVLLKAVLHKEHGILPKGNVLTHITAAKINDYPKILFFTDPAVLPFPTQEQRVEQVKYLSHFCHAFHVEQPKIALIHCSEKIDERHFPYTQGYQEIKKMAENGAFGNCIVDGPLDLKTSCSSEALATKKIESPIKGEADALCFPDIEAGNVFYKTITLFSQAETAAVLQGTDVPVVLASRGDTVESKFYSMALAAIISNNKQ